MSFDVDAAYAEHAKTSLSWFVRRTADTEVALDLWAETWAQAVASRRRFRGSTQEEAAGWLWGIAHRQLAHYHRRGAAERRAMRRLALERPATDRQLIGEIERAAALDDLRRELDDALTTLSLHQRDAVELRVLRGLSYREVAERLEISEPAARARVSRSLHVLAQILERQAVGDAR